MKRSTWLLLTFITLGALIFGCSSPTSVPPIPVDYDRETPDNLINYFGRAYQEKDIAGYKESLHDQFLFEFTSDIAETLGLDPDKPWWGKTEDEASTQNMFDAPTVSSIETQFNRITNWDACVKVRNPESDTPDSIEAVCATFEPDIKVTVETGDDPTIYWVNDSRVDVAVAVDPENEDLWVILEMKETKKNP